MKAHGAYFMYWKSDEGQWTLIWFFKNPPLGLDYEHMIKARAHKGGVRIGKTPKKLASICCP
jgi:hypothetical protein